MDLHQPLLNINSSNRTSTNTGVVLLPPTNNISITTATTNSTLTAAAIENISTSSPSTSPTTSIVNHHHNHHHRNSQNHVTQKTNQVSTVLLYNIPIVSLYIEGQERLCLAQISNTLLKEFSYNEIHNRRVALGITCVQCTPVQLEILRRAGAMPVSSRRCGMITRREAERLCKSFLGDNTPPRLPEDFAFNVQHKCSWGCRGSFLPSRYNSSRAKCIKCHYCGMFFSPNKFIFHSHRIGPGDKYVQPDAANFNSWRRHMMLSGQPPQEVIYAWEDVKAMFNGGTRKRLMISNSSSPLPRVSTSSPGSCSAGASSSSMGRDHSTDDVSRDPLLGNIKKNSNSVNTVTAAAAVVGVTAVAVGSTVRPLNLHFQASTAAGLTTESSYAVGADMHLIPAAALSRSFMMDYMWQHARQAAESSYNQQYQQQNQPQQKVKSSNSAFPLPWINATIGTPSDIQNTENQHSNITYSSSANSTWSNSAATDITRNLSQIINTSAFKPVVRQQHQKKLAETCPSSTRSRRRHSTLQVPTYENDHCSPQMLTSSSQPAQNKLYHSLFSSDEDNDVDKAAADVQGHSNNNDNKRLATDNSEAPEDDILVDIETTEDEKPVSFSTNTSSFTIDNTESRDDIENSALENDKQAASDEDVIDVVHNDNDDTVLEFASLTPLTIIKHRSENYRKALSAPSDFASPNVTLTGSQELDQLYNVDRSNSENVPPPASSISPKSNSNSSGSRSSECFYVKGKNHYREAASPNPVPKTISRSPDTFVDHKINLDVTNQEKSTKNFRKRPCEKTIQNYDKVTWRQINDSIGNDNTDEDGQCDNANAIDFDSKYKKKSNQPNTKEVQLIEALTQKYDLTYYNNNSSSCKNNYVNSNINNNNSPISNNNLINVNNNEFWQMARLCMQRPINYEQNQKVQPNQQQMERLPAFYYRQHQLHLSAAEQHHQNTQTATFPAAQQVYLHLQQQLVQKTNNHYSNKIIQPPISNSSSHIPAMYVSETSDASSGFTNMQQNNMDSTNKANRANGIG